MVTEHHDRLCRMVAFRLDHRLQGRVDPSDVVQDVYVQATTYRSCFRRRLGFPLFLWLRGIAGNKLLEVHRRHLGTRMRDAGREAGPGGFAASDSTSGALVVQLTGGATGPGTAAARAEVKLRLREALDGMDTIDREVLACGISSNSPTARPRRCWAFRTRRGSQALRAGASSGSKKCWRRCPAD